MHNVDNATYPTNSTRLCYTCIEQPCLVTKRQAYRAKVPLIKTPQRGEQNKWRDALIKETRNLCGANAGIQEIKDAAGCTAFNVTTYQINSQWGKNTLCHIIQVICGEMQQPGRVRNQQMEQ